MQYRKGQLMGRRGVAHAALSQADESAPGVIQGRRNYPAGGLVGAVSDLFHAQADPRLFQAFDAAPVRHGFAHIGPEFGALQDGKGFLYLFLVVLGGRVPIVLTYHRGYFLGSVEFLVARLFLFRQ